MVKQFDVAVVGAGTAGAAAAAFCAEQGLRVCLLERRPLEQAGARWINGVPAWAFERARLALPQAPELRGHGQAFHMLAGYGPQRLRVDGQGVLELDMRRLVARLQQQARDHGTQLRGQTAVHGLSAEGLETSAGSVRARWIVDASGLSGARLLAQPRVDPRHLCAAAQELREITDTDAAAAWFAGHGVGMGETLCFTGIAGGYSILMLRADSPRELNLLSGTIPARGQPSGTALLQDVCQEHAWIGGKILGGRRAIPLRRPYDRLSDGRVALLGDAGCQVFSAHGSGIGIGLVAARLLADELAAGRGLTGYATRFQRELGGLLASVDLFRRFSQSLSAHEMGQLMAGGVVDSEMAGAALVQRLPCVRLARLPGQLAGLLRQPGVALRALKTGLQIGAAQLLYRHYRPEHAGWSRLVAAVFGESSDAVARPVRVARVGAAG